LPRMALATASSMPTTSEAWLHRKAIAETGDRQGVELWTQDLLAPDQDDGAITVVTQEFKHSGQRDRWTVVAAHAIHREGDRHRWGSLPGLYVKTAGRA
jgi:hypothetical protein